MPHLITTALLRCMVKQLKLQNKNEKLPFHILLQFFQVASCNVFHDFIFSAFISVNLRFRNCEHYLSFTWKDVGVSLIFNDANNPVFTILIWKWFVISKCNTLHDCDLHIDALSVGTLFILLNFVMLSDIFFCNLVKLNKFKQWSIV